MMSKMKFSKIYKIEQEWTKWGKTIANSITDFQKTFTFSPNILEANKHTLSQFDFLCNIDPREREHVVKTNSITDMPEEITEENKIILSSFELQGISLEFAEEESIPDKEFCLIYDSNPEWDDEIEFAQPVPDKVHILV